MTIDRVETFVLVHQMKRGRGPSIANYRTRESVLLKITDSSGAVGWGETYAVAGIVGILHDVGEMLKGRDPIRAREIWAATWNSTENACATSVTSIAIDDLRGKLLNMSVAGLYGGAVRQRVRAYASSGGYYDGVDPKDTWPDEFAELTGMGFTAIKMRVGRYPIAHELALIERLRADYPALDFMADGNAAYTLPRAHRDGPGPRPPEVHLVRGAHPADRLRGLRADATGDGPAAGRRRGPRDARRGPGIPAAPCRRHHPARRLDVRRDRRVAVHGRPGAPLRHAVHPPHVGRRADGRGNAPGSGDPARHRRSRRPARSRCSSTT